MSLSEELEEKVMYIAGECCGCDGWDVYSRVVRPLVEALEKIANEDYRGNRPWSATVAHDALEAARRG